MAIKLRVNQATALTYNEMDKNFSSFFYSASIDNGGAILKLWYTGSSDLNILPGEDFGPGRYVDINLQPTDGDTPTLVVAGNERNIQYRNGNVLGASSDFIYTTEGHLGVGIATPVKRLHVKGNTSHPATLRLDSVLATNNINMKSTVEFFQNGRYYGLIGRDNPADSHLYIKTYPGKFGDDPASIYFQLGNNTNSAALTPVGLGVGTLGPQRALHVIGDGFFTSKLGVGSLASSEALNVFQNTQLQATGGVFQHIAKFGIIPISSVNTLNITAARTSGGSDWQTSGMRLQQQVDNTYMSYIQFSGDNNNYGFSIGTGAADISEFDNYNDIPERFRINSSGLVGINTNNPTERLTIQGNISGSGNIKVNGSANIGTTATVGSNATIGGTLTLAPANIPQDGAATPKILSMNSSTGQVQYINNIVPLGAIMMWTASIAPSGWAICDGNNGNLINGIRIPDLRERFIVGAGSSPDIITYNYDTFTMSSTGLPFRTGTGTGTAVYPSGAPIYTGISVVGTFNKVNNTSAVSNGVFYNSINSGTGNPPGYAQYALYALTGPTPATSFFLVYHMEDKNYRLYRGSVPPNNTNISNFGSYPYFSPPQGSIATLSQVGEFVTYRPNFSSLIWTENTAGYAIGDKGGLVNVQLGVSELASHYHEVKAYAGVNTTVSPNNLNINSPTNGPAASDSGLTGGNLPHENRPPYYALAFIIYTGV